jgi:hypothetical protein
MLSTVCFSHVGFSALLMEASQNCVLGFHDVCFVCYFHHQSDSWDGKSWNQHLWTSIKHWEHSTISRRSTYIVPWSQSVKVSFLQRQGHLDLVPFAPSTLVFGEVTKRGRKKLFTGSTVTRPQPRNRRGAVSQPLGSGGIKTSGARPLTRAGRITCYV